MGFRISWLAAKGMSATDLLGHFQLEATVRPDRANEAPFSVASLPTGWTVLWSNDPTFASIERCQTLSKAAPVISCWVNETVMFSSANYFENGNYLWFVGHNAQDGTYSLEVDGNLPSQFEAIKARLMEQQEAEGGTAADVDLVFDIPLETAQAICGFKHDLSAFAWGEAEFFEAFDPSTNYDSKSKGWLGRLFGR